MAPRTDAERHQEAGSLAGSVCPKSEAVRKARIAQAELAFRVPGGLRYNQRQSFQNVSGSGLIRPGARSARQTSCSGATLGVTDYLERVCQVIRDLDRTQVETLSDLIERQYRSGRFVFASSAARRLGGQCVPPLRRPREVYAPRLLKPAAQAESSQPDRQTFLWVTAIANDLSYREVFLEQLREPCLRRRSPDRDLRLRQQPQYSFSSSTWATFPRPHHARPDRLHGGRRSRPWPITTFTCRSTTWASWPSLSISPWRFTGVIDDLYRRFAPAVASLRIDLQKR